MQTHLFDYHKDLAEHFHQQRKTWEWFSAFKAQQDEINTFKNELLKNTYRLSPDSEAHIYALVDKAKTTLDISKPVVVFQELDSYETNASVLDVGDEINILISGKLLSLLTEQELLAVFAHELTHMVFYQLESGKYEVTSRIIRSIADDYRSPSVMLETARLYQLYTELFCDRGALHVVGNIETVIEALVKVSTGLDTVSATNYLKQAHEIFSKDAEQTGSNRHSHPETFIRAIALETFHNQAQEKQDHKHENKQENEATHTHIAKMIDANWSMSKLDIFKQASLQDTTETLIKLITKPTWMQTDNIMALCQQYFPTFKFATVVERQDLSITKDLESWFDNIDDSIREYFSYVLLDVCFADSQLESAPMGHVFQIAEALNFHKTFRQIMKKELKTTVKKLDSMIKKAVVTVSELSESEDESVLLDE